MASGAGSTPTTRWIWAARGAMATLRQALEEVQPLRSNFAALAIESSTAIRQFLVMAQILHHIDADYADPHADRGMRTALHHPGRAVFRAAVRDRGQDRCLPAVRNRKRAGTWRPVPRRPAGGAGLSGLCAQAGPGRDPDGLLRCGAFCRTDTRQPCDRAAARAHGQCDDAERPERRRGADLQHAWARAWGAARIPAVWRTGWNGP